MSNITVLLEFDYLQHHLCVTCQTPVQAEECSTVVKSSLSIEWSYMCWQDQAVTVHTRMQPGTSQ
jgi:hypothetical protein